MNVKKMIILCIILTLLTTGVVCAVENTSDDSNNKIENVGAISDDKISNIEDNEYTSKDDQKVNVDVSGERFASYDDNDSYNELKSSNDKIISKSEQNIKSDYNNQKKQ